MTTQTLTSRKRVSQHLAATAAAAPRPELSAELVEYLANSYPHNHDYRITGGKLAPRCKLWVRLRKLIPLYPSPLTSLLDLSCCKGYFVAHAAMQPSCRRALGIDIHEPDLLACEAVKAHLGLSQARFERLRLHELASGIDDFGGPFQTVLLINTYQYLYFGSPRSPECYLSHDEIFRQIRRVCHGRVIFNNRTELHRVQKYGREKARELGHEGCYNTAAVKDAAAKYFRVNEHGTCGRYVLWTLEAR